MALSFLAFWATSSINFLLPAFAYLVLLLGFLVWNRRLADELLKSEIEIDKNLTEQNECQRHFEERQKKSWALQSKYLTYYNLRKSIEDFAAYRSVEKLSRLITAEAYEFLKKGDRASLLLGTPDGSKLQVVATRSLDSESKEKYGEGDFFDYWVLTNRQSLLITDLEKDIRFGVERKSLRESFESAVIIPLSLESSGGGVLRINSSKKEAFTVDDMRILQVLCNLASTALLNSFLFLKTEELAIRDSLTGLYVQRHFKERLEEECKRVRVNPEHTFTMLLMDLDYFKKFNDSYGHMAGDIALFEVAKHLNQEIGSGGLLARYGGEEFAVILFQKSKKEGFEIAENLRKSMEALTVTIRDKNHRFTISCGVAEFAPEKFDEEKLIQAADKALYEAKKEGRNKVCVSK